MQLTQSHLLLPSILMLKTYTPRCQALSIVLLPETTVCLFVQPPANCVRWLYSCATARTCSAGHWLTSLWLTDYAPVPGFLSTICFFLLRRINALSYKFLRRKLAQFLACLCLLLMGSDFSHQPVDWSGRSGICLVFIFRNTETCVVFWLITVLPGTRYVRTSHLQAFTSLFTTTRRAGCVLNQSSYPRSFVCSAMSKPRVFATPYSSRAVKSKRKLNKITSHAFKFNSKNFIIRATRLVSWSVPQIEGRPTANLHISRRLAPPDYSKLDIFLWKLETHKNRVLFLPPREFFPFLSFWRVVDFFLRPVRKYLDKIPLPNLSSERLHSVCYAYTFSVLAFMAIGSISGCLTREHTFSVWDIFEFMAILFLPSIIASNLSSGLLGRVPTFQKNVIVLFWLLVFIYGVTKYIPTPGELHEFYLRVPYSNGVLRDNSLCTRRWTLTLPWSERTMVEALRQYIVEYKFGKKLPTDVVTRLRLDAEAQISNCTKLWSQFGGVRSKVALDEYLKQRTAQYLKSFIKVEPKLTTVQKFARAVATTLNFVAPIADAGANGVIFVAKWAPVVGALILVGFVGPKILGG